MRDFSPVSSDDLTEVEQDLTEDLLDFYELRRLDTRDRDMARHAIYQAIRLARLTPQG